MEAFSAKVRHLIYIFSHSDFSTKTGLERVRVEADETLVSVHPH